MISVRRIAALGWRAIEGSAYALAARQPIVRGARHRLDREVVVSLTSFPPRFSTLHLTLRTLLNQSVSPDRIVLWIAHQDMALLPPKVLALQTKGIEIRPCDDLRSFKKIVPATEQFPDSYIVTADDDLYYRRDWLRIILSAAGAGTKDVVCRIVHRPSFDGDQLRPFSAWPLNVTDATAHQPSNDLFCGSGAGALFPPRSLHADVVRRDLFERLTPDCDDSWITWMIHRQGTKIRRAPGPKRELKAWLRTVRGSLAETNFVAVGEGVRMDRFLANLSDYFGPLHRLGAENVPPTLPAIPRRSD